MQQEIIVALVAAVMGWALSQVMIGWKISKAVSAVELQVSQSVGRVELSMRDCINDNNRTKDDLAALRHQTSEQLISTNLLVTKVLDMGNNLIGLVTIQNALLREKDKE